MGNIGVLVKEGQSSSGIFHVGKAAESKRSGSDKVALERNKMRNEGEMERR